MIFYSWTSSALLSTRSSLTHSFLHFYPSYLSHPPSSPLSLSPAPSHTQFDVPWSRWHLVFAWADQQPHQHYLERTPQSPVRDFHCSFHGGSAWEQNPVDLLKAWYGQRDGRRGTEGGGEARRPVEGRIKWRREVEKKGRRRRDEKRRKKKRRRRSEGTEQESKSKSINWVAILPIF